MLTALVKRLRVLGAIVVDWELDYGAIECFFNARRSLYDCNLSLLASC